ncbi:hypothetical protein KU406_23320, partial [Salmonella enterica subsp. enterica serovar Montevideo]|nr:hypothetical protein [Salmonella enterica subsp. enterica serovar Montevideo]
NSKAFFLRHFKAAKATAGAVLRPTGSKIISPDDLDNSLSCSAIYRYISFLVLLIGIVIGFGIYFFIDSVNAVSHVFIYWAFFV